MSLHRGPVLATIEDASGSRLSRSCRPGSGAHDARRACHRRHRVYLRQAHSAPHAVRITAYVPPVEQTIQLKVGEVLRGRMCPLRVVERHVVPHLLLPECATQPLRQSCILRPPSVTLRLGVREYRRRVKHNKVVHGPALLRGRNFSRQQHLRVEIRLNTDFSMTGSTHP